MKKLNLRKITLVLTAPAIMAISGCHYHEPPPPPPPCHWGYDGATGSAFFALDWSDAPPQYLWTNNAAIPAVFEYGSYYMSAPGHYDLYYEGEIVVNCCPEFYYWNVAYDIWVHPGSAGGPCGANGADGADSWLEIVCSPWGPYDYRTNKTTSSSSGLQVISDTGDEVIAEQRLGDLVMRVTYTRLDHSRKGELDPTEVRVALPKEVK